MFAQIVNEMAKKDNWDPSIYGPCFDCSYFSNEDIGLIFSFFEKHDIIPTYNYYSDRKTFVKNIILSEEDYKTFHQACKLYNKQTHLLEDAEIYEPLSDDELDYIKEHIKLELNEEVSDVETEKQKSKLLNNVLKKVAHKALATRILKEFLYLCKELERPNNPIYLTINMNENGQLQLENEQAYGLASTRNGKPYIIMNNKDDINSFFIGAFFHELRHINQKGLLLSPSPKKNPLSNLINSLAQEAEAKAYQLIIDGSEIFSQDISHQLMHQMAHSVIEEKETVSYKKDLTQAEKIAATLRYMQIRTNEETIQLLCDSFLSKNRIEVYRQLNKKNIHLDPAIFNDLASAIEKWRNFYFSRNTNIYIEEEKKTPSFDQQQLEDEWKIKTGLELSLSPTLVFSKEIAKSVGIHALIYQKQPNLEPEYSLNYARANKDIPDALFLFRTRQFDMIEQLYDQIQQENTLLPSLKKLKENKINLYRLAESVSAIQQKKPIKEIFAKLGYSLTDSFYPTYIKKNKQTAAVNKQQNQRQ